MDNGYLSKICLGTAQFGMAYGIANVRGQVPQPEVVEILCWARQQGIEFLDTAHGYGESESVLGQALRESGRAFCVVSKFPDVRKLNGQSLDSVFRSTLQRLGMNQIYGYLVHKAENLWEGEDLWSFLRGLREQMLVKKIGVSVYGPDELTLLLKHFPDVNLVQIPFSVFDRRFQTLLPELKAKNIEIHARSVFLQGLAFMDGRRIPERLRPAQNALCELRRVAETRGSTVAGVCLNYVLRNEHIDQVVMGVDSLAQLQDNVTQVLRFPEGEDLVPGIDALSIADENVLLPSKW